MGERLQWAMFQTTLKEGNSVIGLFCCSSDIVVLYSEFVAGALVSICRKRRFRRDAVYLFHVSGSR